MVGRDSGSSRPSSEVFEEALRELHKGRIPEKTMPFIAAYIYDAAKERSEYLEAITECALRLEKSNKVLREMSSSLQASLMRLLGRKGVAPEKARFVGDLIPWLANRAQIEQEEGHEKSAEMLELAFEAVVMLVSEGRATVNGK